MNFLKFTSQFSKCRCGVKMERKAGGIRDRVQNHYARLKILKRSTSMAGTLGLGAGQGEIKEGARGLGSGMNFIKLPVKNLKIFRCQDYINTDGIAGGMKILKRSITKAGNPGSGAGQGGGAGGTVKESGGGLGLWAAANEEGYFFKKQKKQLQEIKKQLEGEKKNEETDDKK